MNPTVEHRKWVWLTVGLLAGLGIANFWPHEQAHAIAVDRNNKFAVATCPVNFTNTVEAVFVLDFLTGQLQGRVLNPTVGKFMHSYFRNVAADFSVDPKAEPQYTIVAGQATLTSKGRQTNATGVVYIGELTSGKMICYRFLYTDTRVPLPTQPLLPLDFFQFRESSSKN